MEKNKVFFVLNNASFFISHRLNIAEKLIENNTEVFLCSPKANNHDIEILIQKNIKVIELPFQREKLSIYALLKSFFIIFKLGINNKNAVFHFVTIISIIIGGVPLRILNNRCVFSISGMGTIFTSKNILNILNRYIVLNTYKFIFNGKNSRLILQNKDDYKYFLNKVKIHKKNIFLVEGSGVNKNEFKYYSELNYNETAIILFPARIIKEKGIKELIEASKNLTNKNFKHEVWIAGDIDLGNPSSLSLSEVNILKNEALNLKFLGYQKDMPKILEQCTIVCLPSYREGLPKALIEASACGRPIITCDVPGCNEIVEDNFNGVLVKPKSSIDLENAIENLLQDGEKMERLRKNAYNKFLNNYTSEITVNKIFQVYLSI